MVSKSKPQQNQPSASSRQHGLKPPPPSSSSSLCSSPTPLIDLIERREFEQVVRRVRADPHEAHVVLSHNSVMNQGNLALHEACRNQPTVTVIDALLQANEAAIKMKGHWGYLPLHFACASRASSEVVARLLVAHPAAARARDDHEGSLALHLAAKWGASEEVVTDLLIVYPKGGAVRDASHKTPADHATAEGAVRALQRAPVLCAVSKAATNKLARESDAKLREVVEVYQDKLFQVKEQCDQERSNAERVQAELRKELWEERQRSTILSQKLARLTRIIAQQERTIHRRNQSFQRLMDVIAEEQRDTGDDEPEYAIDPIKAENDLSQRAKREWEAAASQHTVSEYSARAISKEPPYPITPTNVHDGVPSNPYNDDERDDDSVSRRTTQLMATKSVDEDFDHRDDGDSYDASHPELPSNPSPRSAAISTVREWFLSSTTMDEAEEEIESQERDADEDAVQSKRVGSVTQERRTEESGNSRGKQSPSHSNQSTKGESNSVKRPILKARSFASTIPSPGNAISSLVQRAHRSRNDILERLQQSKEVPEPPRRPQSTGSILLRRTRSSPSNTVDYSRILPRNVSPDEKTTASADDRKLSSSQSVYSPSSRSVTKSSFASRLRQPSIAPRKQNTIQRTDSTESVMTAYKMSLLQDEGDDDEADSITLDSNMIEWE